MQCNNYNVQELFVQKDNNFALIMVLVENRSNQIYGCLLCILIRAPVNYFDERNKNQSIGWNGE